MSDGNFNRALLPKNELSAGIRVGKAQMRTKAEQAFCETLRHYYPEMSESAQQEIKDYFMNALRNETK